MLNIAKNADMQTVRTTAARIHFLTAPGQGKRVPKRNQGSFKSIVSIAVGVLVVVPASVAVSSSGVELVGEISRAARTSASSIEMPLGLLFVTILSGFMVLIRAVLYVPRSTMIWVLYLSLVIWNIIAFLYGSLIQPHSVHSLGLSAAYLAEFLLPTLGMLLPVQPWLEPRGIILGWILGSAGVLLGHVIDTFNHGSFSAGLYPSFFGITDTEFQQGFPTIFAASMTLAFAGLLGRNLFWGLGALLLWTIGVIALATLPSRSALAAGILGPLLVLLTRAVKGLCSKKEMLLRITTIVLLVISLLAGTASYLVISYSVSRIPITERLAIARVLAPETTSATVSNLNRLNAAHEGLQRMVGSIFGDAYMPTMKEAWSGTIYGFPRLFASENAWIDLGVRSGVANIAMVGLIVIGIIFLSFRHALKSRSLSEDQERMLIGVIAVTLLLTVLAGQFKMIWGDAYLGFAVWLLVGVLLRILESSPMRSRSRLGRAGRGARVVRHNT